MRGSSHLKSVCSLSSCTGLNVLVRLMRPSSAADCESHVYTDPKKLFQTKYYHYWSKNAIKDQPSSFRCFSACSHNHSTHLAAILVPMLRSKGEGRPPCCMWPWKMWHVKMQWLCTDLNYDARDRVSTENVGLAAEHALALLTEQSLDELGRVVQVRLLVPTTFHHNLHLHDVFLNICFYFNLRIKPRFTPSCIFAFICRTSS